MKVIVVDEAERRNASSNERVLRGEIDERGGDNLKRPLENVLYTYIRRYVRDVADN